MQLKKERTQPASLLSQGKPQSSVQVIHILGGGEARRKLYNMGIIPGEKLQVIKNEPSGPVLISFHGGTLMIGKGLADKVRITPLL